MGDGDHGLRVRFLIQAKPLVFTSCMRRTPQFVYLYQDSCQWSKYLVQLLEGEVQLVVFTCHVQVINVLRPSCNQS